MSRTRFAGIHLNNVAAAPEIVSLLARSYKPYRPHDYIRRKTVFSTKNQLLCFVEFFAEVGVSYGIIADEVYPPPKEIFKFVHEIEEDVSPVKPLAIDRFVIEIDREIHVAAVVEARGEYGTEHPQLCYLVLAAQGGDPVDVHFNQFHVAKYLWCTIRDLWRIRVYFSLLSLELADVL